MAACDVFDALRYATESLDTHIYRAASYRSIWLNLIQRSTYPLNVGTYRTVFAIGNTEPTTDTGASWTKLDLSQAGAPRINTGMDTPTEFCTNSWNDVVYGMKEMTYGPEQQQLRGPVICKKDLLFSHEPDAFLRGYMEEITKRAKREWELNYAYHHRRLSMKAIATTDFEANWKEQEDLGATNALPAATCELSQEMLEKVAQRLIEDGATNPDSNGFITWQESGPVFSLYIGMDQSARLLRQNADLREDYRFADPNLIIARIGASRVIGNFRHIINQRPKRYTWAGNAYTEVQPYIDQAGTKGTYQIINPAWRSAPYEGADVLSPELYVSEVVPPKNSAGGISFKPTSYMGEWSFVAGAYKWNDTTDDNSAGVANCKTDPQDQKGRHFAEFIHAPKPNPWAVFKYGWHIIYKRCVANQVECTTCSS